MNIKTKPADLGQGRAGIYDETTLNSNTGNYYCNLREVLSCAHR